MFENEGEEIKIELQPCIIAQAIRSHARYMSACLFSDGRLPEQDFNKFVNQLLVAGIVDFNKQITLLEKSTTKTPD